MSPASEQKKYITRKVNKYLSHVKPDSQGWPGTLESLKSLIFNIEDEDNRNIQMKVKYFEQSINDLKNRFANKMSHEQEIHIEIWLGNCYEKYGIWDKASNAYDKAINLCTLDSDNELITEAYCSLGDIWLMKNRWKIALEAYQSALDIAKKNNDHIGAASTLNSMGILKFERGEFDTAFDLWQDGIQYAEKKQHKKLSAQIYNNLGALMSTQGNWNEALTNYTKCGLLFEEVGDFRGLAETYHNMAMTYADVKNWTESNKYYEKSFNLAKDIGDVRLKAMVCLNRAEIYTHINDIYVGLALCNQALRTFVELEDHLGEAETYKFMGVLYTKVKEWDLASSFFDDSLELAEKYKNPLLHSEVLFEYGRLCKITKKHQDARKYWQKSLLIFKSLKAESDIQRVKKEISNLKQ